MQRAMAGLAVVALGCSVWWWQDSQAFEAEAERLAAATTRTETLIAQQSAQMTQEGLTLSAQDMVRIRMDVAFLNQLARKRAFSWVKLLGELEATIPLSVLIASVKVNFQDATISIHGRSKDLPSLNTFVTNLQSHPAFRKAALVNHHVREEEEGKKASRPSNGMQEIEFSLTAQYRIGAAEGAEHTDGTS